LDDGLILKKTASGYELIEIGGRIFTFNTSGRLISIKDLRGNAVTLGYNADGKPEWVKDATGRQVLTFTYNAAKRIDSATDFAGRIINYEYDQIGRIIKVKQAGITIAVYTYNNYHGITSKANALNETYTIEYEYPDKGIVKRIIDPVGTEMIALGQSPEGHEKTFGYDFANKTFYTTDGRGVTKKKILRENGALLLEEEINGADAIPTKKIEYLANKIEKITDAAGNITTIQRDEWRNVIKAVDGEGATTSITYNSDKKPVTITDALGTVTQFEYDSYGNPLKITQAKGKPEETTKGNRVKP